MFLTGPLSHSSLATLTEKQVNFPKLGLSISLTKGVYHLTTYINFYMLSLDGKLLNYPEVAFTLLITSGERGNTLRKVLGIRNHLPDA